MKVAAILHRRCGLSSVMCAVRGLARRAAYGRIQVTESNMKISDLRREMTFDSRALTSVDPFRNTRIGSSDESRDSSREKLHTAVTDQARCSGGTGPSRTISLISRRIVCVGASTTVLARAAAGSASQTLAAAWPSSLRPVSTTRSPKRCMASSGSPWNRTGHWRRVVRRREGCDTGELDHAQSGTPAESVAPGRGAEAHGRRR